MMLRILMSTYRLDCEPFIKNGIYPGGNSREIFESLLDGTNHSLDAQVSRHTRKS